MKFIRCILVSLLFAAGYTASSQNLHSIEQLERIPADVLSARLNYYVPNGAVYYKMTYHTTGSDGLPDIASGLVVMPDNDDAAYSKVIYHHGTSNTRNHVPSAMNIEFDAYSVFAGVGYAVIAPDYIGMGEYSRGFHPYLHRQTQASASIDMLKAFHEWAEKENITLSNNLFLTGYSQGGHASMSTHLELEANYAGIYEVTAAAHLSGPYSLSTVTKDIIFGSQDYNFPGFIPYAILGLQEVYGDIYNSMDEVFIPSLIPAIVLFYNGQTSLIQLSLTMLFALSQRFGNAHPVNMFQPDFTEAFLEDENHRLNVVLRDNDTYNWAPRAPTRLFYCKADEQVPYQNSLHADSAMRFLGATNLQIRDVNPLLNHGQCAVPAIIASIEFFDQFRATSSTLSAESQKRYSIFPNPATQYIEVNTAQEGVIYVYDITGKLLIQKPSNQQIDLSHLNKGIYLVKIEGNDFVATEKIFKQ
jgi:pimeloyl-ACP methyl ester carboxylesterase